MADIRLSTGFPDHPKTKKLARKCGYEAVLCLVRLWAWSSQNRCKGTLDKMDQDDIEIASGWNGKEGDFINACLKFGWIDEDNGVFCLHDWEENQPWAFFSEDRSNKAKKAAKARWDNRLNGKKDGEKECNKHASSNATSMPPACHPHAFSNAPSPTPTPTPTPSVKKKAFSPPSVSEVEEYCRSREGNIVDSESFVDFYSSKGWMIGKNKMKDWKAAVRTWERKDKERQEEDKPKPFDINSVL